MLESLFKILIPVSTWMLWGFEIQFIPSFFELLLCSNYIEIRGRLCARPRCWSLAKSVSIWWSFSPRKTCTTTCSTWWSATWGSSTWRGECNYILYHGSLEYLDLRLDLSRVPCSCNVIGYYAAVQDWTRKYSPGKVAAVGPTLCVSSIRIVLQHGLGSVGSREFQRMSPQKWYSQ